jgi:hypothetical protein
MRPSIAQISGAWLRRSDTHWRKLLLVVKERKSMIRVIEGKGRDLDRSGNLIEAIMQAVDDHAEGMTIVSVIGCLEMAKVMVMTESVED